MIKDEQIQILFEYVDRGASKAEAARRAGMSYATALKYLKSRLFPREIKELRTRQSQRLFDDDWEKYVLPYLEDHVGTSASQVLDHLIDVSDNKYSPSMLRTLERRLKEWKNKPYATRIADPVDTNWPDSLCVTAFLIPEYKIYVRGHELEHYLFLFYYPFHGWVFLAPSLRGSFKESLELFEEVLWKSGLLPKYHMHYPSQELEKGAVQRYDYWEVYKKFMKRYGIRTIDKQETWAPRFRKFSRKILFELDRSFPKKPGTWYFNAVAEYEMHTRKVADKLNDDIPGDVLLAIKSHTRGIEMEKGILEEFKREPGWPHTDGFIGRPKMEKD